MVADIDPASADHVRAELAMRGGIAASMQVDSTDRRSLQSLAARTVGEFGAVHLLVNTVGVIFDCSLTDATDTDWSWVFELNVVAQVRAVDVFLSLLRASGARCHIVTTASGGGLVAAPPGMQIGLYTATKHALVGYSETLRAELAPHGIGVSVLCPSRVAGNLADTSARDRLARVGILMPEENGKPLDPATLMPNEVMGPSRRESHSRQPILHFQSARRDRHGFRREVRTPARRRGILCSQVTKVSGEPSGSARVYTVARRQPSTKAYWRVRSRVARACAARTRVRAKAASLSAVLRTARASYPGANV
jgi:NAD(P)-dependent dehydrogenase (short-subunit alcohol dehydrogenase family)